MFCPPSLHTRNASKYPMELHWILPWSCRHKNFFPADFIEKLYLFFFSTDTLSHFGSLTFLSLCLQYSGLMVLLSHKQVPSFSPRLPAVNNGCGFSQFAGVICTALTCSDPYLPGSASRQVQEQEECAVPVVKEPSSPGSSVTSL